MSSVAETEKRSRVPFIAAAIAVALVLLLVIGLLTLRPDRSGSPSSPQRVAPREIKQARWRVETFAVGGVSRMKPKDRKAVNKQGVRLERTVRRIYDALFLKPQRADRVIRASFVRSAARSMRGPSIGVPARAQNVQTTSRRATIGIDALSARSAVGEVNIRVRGLRNDHAFRVMSSSTLWLERLKGRWQVIAYEVQQRPFERRDGGPPRKAKAGDKRAAQSSKGGRSKDSGTRRTKNPDRRRDRSRDQGNGK